MITPLSGLVLFGLLKATSWLTDCLSRMNYPHFVSHINPCSPSSWIYKIPFCLVKSWISSYPFVSHDINHKSYIAFYSHDIPFKSQLYPRVWWSNPNHIAGLYPQSRSGWWFGTFFFPFSWECHHPNWRSPSFFQMVKLNHQPEIISPCFSDGNPHEKIPNHHWLVVSNIFYLSIYWEQWSQLTNSYFSDG